MYLTFAGPALAADVFGHAAGAGVFVFRAPIVVLPRVSHFVGAAARVGAAVAIPGIVGGRVAHALRLRWKAQINTYVCDLFRGS